MAGLLIEAELGATIRQWASSPCSLFPCGQEVWGYACRLQGIEAPALPDHSTVGAMARLLWEKGGLAAYAGELMASLGWQPVDVPERGDVAVALVEGAEVCAICLAAGDLPNWMLKGDHRFVTVHAPFLQAWRLPCRPL